MLALTGIRNEMKRNLHRHRMVRSMKVKFVLTMDDLVVDDRSIDQVVLDWESDMELHHGRFDSCLAHRSRPQP